MVIAIYHVNLFVSIVVFRLACIAESLSMHDKMQVIVKLQAYWTLKRRARNGVPLLRRLQLGATPATAASTVITAVFHWSHHNLK